MLMAAAILNALYNHVVGPFTGIPLLYPVAFFIGVGTILPALVLGQAVRRTPRLAMDLGLSPGQRDVVASIVVVLVGGALAAAPLGPILGQPGGSARVGALFCQLLVASTAEVILFLGVMGVVVHPGSERRTWIQGASLIAVSSVAFALFHFTYPVPWNSLSTVATVGVVWLLVSTCFVTSRSLVAAVLLDNIMATIGFATRGLTLPLPAPTALVLAGVAAVAFAGAFRWSRGMPGPTSSAPSPGTTA